MQYNNPFIIAAMLVTWTVTSSAVASFTVYKNLPAWTAASGPITTLDFVFPPDGVFMSDQYESLGVLFPDGEEGAVPNAGAFPNDGWGCIGAFINDDDIHLKFLSPQYSIGAWFPGNLTAKLYWQGQLIYWSPSLWSFPGYHSFGGVVSTDPFDEIVFFDPSGGVNIDDILFASPVPCAGALSLSAMLGIVGAGRRRRR